jgi:hypothetical protein
MSVDACLMECSFSLCVSFLILWQSRLRSARGLLVLINSPHSSNEDHERLDFPISLSVQVGNKHAVLCFCFLDLGIRPSSVFT